MSFSKEYSIWCDRCGEWEQISAGFNTAFRQYVVIFRKRGWLVKAQTGTAICICPKCQELEKASS